MRIIGWNVDTQYDFMRKDGKLYVLGAEQIEPNLELVTNYIRDSGTTSLSTGDLHDQDSEEISETPDFRTTFPAHCIRDTPGAKYVPATRPVSPLVVDWQDKAVDLERILQAKEIVLYKDRFDIFAGNILTDSILAALAPEKAIVYGVATNVCVDYAVRGLLRRGIEVYVVEDAIMGLPNLPSPIEDWKRLGASLVKTDEVPNLVRYNNN
jgi:nicotinamidase/pyrazinamidase